MSVFSFFFLINFQMNNGKREGLEISFGALTLSYFHVEDFITFTLVCMYLQFCSPVGYLSKKRKREKLLSVGLVIYN